MSRWKELPAELDPPVRQLVIRLRRLKDHGGLSMRQLAAKTGYSTKSWERYLGGRSLPPRDAVEALARVAGDDPTRLMALHEVAAEAWGQRRESASEPGTTTVAAGPEAGTDAEVNSSRARGRSSRSLLVVGAAAVVLVVAVSSAVLLGVRLTHAEGTPGAANVSSSASAPASGAPSASATGYACHIKQVKGQWYTGNSSTRTALVSYGQSGPEVAEAQCLLRRRGFSPGAIDGVYGPLTQRAVLRLQTRDGLGVDGIVGPHTWKDLRG